jgi:hypothetical protein
MTITHKFLDDLEQLESHQRFCNQSLPTECNVLIIGTFNPADNSISKPNIASWFYGRNENNFWNYIPKAVNGSVLKSDESKWKTFCIDHKIVIVDLIKSIHEVDKLGDFKDSSLDSRITSTLSNVDVFDFGKAFKGVHFEKVIYTRKTWFPKSEDQIPNLTKIRHNVNIELVEKGVVDSHSCIENCYSPWQAGSHVKPDWENALRKFKTP